MSGEMLRCAMEKLVEIEFAVVCAPMSTFPSYPFKLFTVKVAFSNPPGWRVIIVGFSPTLKSGPAGKECKFMRSLQ
jgi:hypothetical protein